MRLPALCRIFLASWGVLLLSGCHAYLHDDDLQKQTDAIASGFSAADIPGAMTKLIDAQDQRDKSDIQSILDRDSAERAAVIASVMEAPEPGAKTPITVLENTITTRMTVLASKTDLGEKSNLLHAFQAIQVLSAQASVLNDELNTLVAAYNRDGGTHFDSCAKFSTTSDIGTPTQADAVSIAAECLAIVNTQGAIDGIKNNSFPHLTAGRIVEIANELKSVGDSLDQERKNQKDAADALNKAASDVKSAASADPSGNSDKFKAAFKTLGDLLSKADQAAGAIGEKDKSPGTVLASVKFKTTTLCDLIAAGDGKSCGGQAATQAGTGAQNQLIQLLTGVADLADSGQDPPPSTLSIAAAYQQGVGNAAQMQIDLLQQEKDLLTDQQQRLWTELALLQRSLKNLREAEDKSPDASCLTSGFSAILPLKPKACHSEDVRDSIARALVAFNDAWVSGRTMATIDQSKLDHLKKRQELLVDQQVAGARAKVLGIVVAQIDTFGQGGVKPETVAGFLQAFGIAAIAGNR